MGGAAGRASTSPRTENGIGKVRPRLVEIGNAVELGRPAHAESLQLRKDIPDPMTLLLPRRNLGESILVIALLRFDKPIDAVLVLHNQKHLFAISFPLLRFAR